MSAVNMMNERSVFVWSHSDGYFQSITVNMLLLGCTSASIGEVDYTQVGRSLKRMEFREEVEKFMA